MSNATNIAPLYLTASKAAKYLGVSLSTFRLMILEAGICRVPFNKVKPLFDRRDLDNISDIIRDKQARKAAENLAALKNK